MSHTSTMVLKIDTSEVDNVMPVTPNGPSSTQSSSSATVRCSSPSVGPSAFTGAYLASARCVRLAEVRRKLAS